MEEGIVFLFFRRFPILFHCFLTQIVYNTAMILDIIVILIFIIFAVRGKSRGLGESLIRLAAMVAGIALATAFTRPLSALIRKTSLQASMQQGLENIFQGSTVNLLDFIPKALEDTLQNFGVSDLPFEVSHFTTTAVLVLSFLLITTGVSLISLFLRRRLHIARKKGTVIGSTDSFAGFAVGVLKGTLFVFLFLAFMFPLAGIFLPDRIQAINEQLNSSYIAGPLYDINPLLLLLKKFSL